MIHILAGEYPPHSGGVGDYAALIAGAMAMQGEQVHVWAPGNSGIADEYGVVVHRGAGRFLPRDLARLSRELDAIPGQHRILVQWTPHSFGSRSLNVFLPAWLWKRARINRDRIELMVHEPFLAFGEGTWRQSAAAAAHRVMMAVLLDAASKIWVAIPAWEARLRRWSRGSRKDFEWLPVPSNIPLIESAENVRAILAIRSRIAPGGQPVIGHFGTLRPDIARMLGPALEHLLERSNAILLVIGSGNFAFHAHDRLRSTGPLPAVAVAQHLSVCDVLLQPYPDGISTRRGSAMAALSLGLPVVTNGGHLTEKFWTNSGAVKMAPSTGAAELASSTLELLGDRDHRLRLARAGRELYEDRFDVRHTVLALLRNSAWARHRGDVAVSG